MTEPEPALAFTLDPATLREVYPDPAAVQDRIDSLRTDVRTAPDETGELIARNDLVDLLRATGDPDEALDEARAAVDRADIAGTAAQQHLARVRLGQIHTRRGEFAEANLEFTELGSGLRRFGPVIEAYTHQAAGLNAFDQQHWDDACEHFAAALRIRDELELDDAEHSRTALAAAERGRAAAGSSDDEVST